MNWKADFFLQNESIRLKWIGESIRIANWNALATSTECSMTSTRTYTSSTSTSTSTTTKYYISGALTLWIPLQEWDPAWKNLLQRSIKVLQGKTRLKLEYFQEKKAPHFNGHFPGEPGLAGFLKQRMMDVAVTTGATRCKKLQSNHHHQQTNNQCFTGRMPFLSPNQQCQSTEGKIITFARTCLLQAHLGSSKFVFDH